MVFSCMYLGNEAADGRTILPHYNKEVFGVKPHLLILIDYLNVCKSLRIRAHLILALYDQHAIRAENPLRFLSRLHIEVNYGIMVFGTIGMLGCFPIRVSVSKSRVRTVPPKCSVVRR